MILLTDKQKYYLFGTLKIFMMFRIPIIASLIIWGAIKEPSNNTFVGRLGLGIFIAGFLILIFLSDFIKHEVEQVKLDKRISFLKNRWLSFLIVGLIFFGFKYIADDAIIFCIVGAASHLAAKIPEHFEQVYYRKWKP